MADFRNGDKVNRQSHGGEAVGQVERKIHKPDALERAWCVVGVPPG